MADHDHDEFGRGVPKGQGADGPTLGDLPVDEPRGRRLLDVGEVLGIGGSRRSGRRFGRGEYVTINERVASAKTYADIDDRDMLRVAEEADWLHTKFLDYMTRIDNAVTDMNEAGRRFLKADLRSVKKASDSLQYALGVLTTRAREGIKAAAVARTTLPEESRTAVQERGGGVATKKLPLKDAKRKARELGAKYTGVWDGPIGDAHQFQFSSIEDNAAAEELARWMQTQGASSINVYTGKDGSKRMWMVEVSINDIYDPEGEKEPLPWGPAAFSAPELDKIASSHGGRFAGLAKGWPAEGDRGYDFGQDGRSAQAFADEVRAIYRSRAPGEWGDPVFAPRSKGMGFHGIPRGNYEASVASEVVKGSAV